MSAKGQPRGHSGNYSDPERQRRAYTNPLPFEAVQGQVADNRICPRCAVRAGVHADFGCKNWKP